MEKTTHAVITGRQASPHVVLGALFEPDILDNPYTARETGGSYGAGMRNSAARTHGSVSDMDVRQLLDTAAESHIFTHTFDETDSILEFMGVVDLVSVAEMGKSPILA